MEAVAIGDTFCIHGKLKWKIFVLLCLAALTEMM